MSHPFGQRRQKRRLLDCLRQRDHTAPCCLDAALPNSNGDALERRYQRKTLRVLVVALTTLSIACGRDSIPYGTLCEGVTCSGHGVCVVVEGSAVCTCDPGYHADGLTCVENQDAPDCCHSDTDCVDDSGQTSGICVNGVCKEVPSSSFCWSDSDCYDRGFCSGEFVCPCGEQCDRPDHVGTCLWLGCCWTDEDCLDYGYTSLTYVCVLEGAMSDDAGVCLQLMGGNSCWRDIDCDPGYYCEGASICFGCNGGCDAVEWPGTCLEVCCQSDTDCVDDSDEPTGVCINWVCRWSSGIAGKCWVDAHCPDGMHCEGQRVCPCGNKCPFLEEEGTCVETQPGCCWNDGECVPGWRCMGQYPWDQMGRCVEEPSQLFRCWEDADCEPGQRCAAERVCGCGESCLGGPHPGFCTTLGSFGCCLGDQQCQMEDMSGVCVGSTGGEPGVCVPPAGTNQCWRDMDCEPGFYCASETYCPCQWECDGDMLTAPGTCEPLPDGCCGKHFDCRMNESSETWCAGAMPGNQLGSCKPFPPIDLIASCCWTDQECPRDQICYGGHVCPCGTPDEPCEDGPDTLGVCMDWPF